MNKFETAVLDIGSNTARLTIYRIDAAGYHRLYEHDESRRLRLIDGLDSANNLHSAALDAIVDTLKTYKAHCVSAGIPANNIIAVATSAIRMATNRAEAVARIRADTGISVRVLSEHEEAAYACAGVSHAFATGDTVVFDLGGGGLQTALVSSGSMSHAHGFLLGTLRLLRRFSNYAPMTAVQLEAMRYFVAEKLRSAAWLNGTAKKQRRLIGIGGTLRALACIEQARANVQLPLHGYTLSLETLEAWTHSLARMTTAELLELPGLNASRIDMVLFGAIVVYELMLYTAAKSVTISDTSIRDGILLEHARLHFVDQSGPVAKAA